MNQVKHRDLKEQNNFRKFGDDFTKIYSDDDRHIYVFKRSHKFTKHNGVKVEIVAYEVIKGVKRNNPDGTVAFTYPSSEQFGLYGYTIFGTEDECKRRISSLINQFEWQNTK